MSEKRRLSASVDSDLLEAAQRDVDEGRAASVSAWVNDALQMKADHERRLRALWEYVAAYEADHGVITDEEIDEVTRRDRARAIVVRPSRTRE